MMEYILNPTLIPPEPVDYGGHQEEVELFLGWLAVMDSAQVARVQELGLAAGAHGNSRWATATAEIVAASSRAGLVLGRIAAQRRASNASAASAGREGNQWVLTDFCAGVWAEVLVLRDHLSAETMSIAFEPWQDAFAEPDWLGSGSADGLDDIGAPA